MALRQLLGQRRRAPGQRRHHRAHASQDLLELAALPQGGGHRRDRPGLLPDGRAQGRPQRRPTWSGSASASAPTSAPRSQCRKPLVIHTRAASADTLAILKEEGEDGSAGQRRRRLPLLHRDRRGGARGARPGLLHLVFRHPDLQERADLRDVAAFVPLDRMLIETDSPYLAPVPYRGKTNNPSYVPYVARQIAAAARRAGGSHRRARPAAISSACSAG